MLRTISALTTIATVLGCAPTAPLAPGETSVIMGIPRAADCAFVGGNVTNQKNENVLGKGLNARGALGDAILVCTTEAGQKLQTTDHRQLFARSNSANVVLYTVKPGKNKVSGTQFINSSQFEFWGEFTFVPAL